MKTNSILWRVIAFVVGALLCVANCIALGFLVGRAVENPLVCHVASFISVVAAVITGWLAFNAIMMATERNDNFVRPAVAAIGVNLLVAIGNIIAAFGAGYTAFGFILIVVLGIAVYLTFNHIYWLLKLVQQLVEAQTTSLTLNGRIEQLKAEANDLRNKANDAAKKLKEEQDAHDGCKASLKDITEKREQLQAEYTKLQEAHNKLLQQNKMTNELLENTKKEAEAAQNKFNAEKKQLEEKLAAKEAQVNDIRKELEAAQNKISNLENELATFKKTAEERLESIKQHKKKIEELTQSYNDAVQKYGDTKKAYEAKNAKVEELLKSNEVLQKDSDECHAEIDRLNKSMENVQYVDMDKFDEYKKFYDDTMAKRKATNAKRSEKRKSTKK